MHAALARWRSTACARRAPDRPAPRTAAAGTCAPGPDTTWLSRSYADVGTRGEIYAARARRLRRASGRRHLVLRRGAYRPEHAMRLEKFTIKAQEALRRPAICASARNHQEVGPEHVLRALLDEDGRRRPALLRKLGVEPEARRASGGGQALEQQPQVRGATAEVYLGRRLKDLLDEATRQSKEFKDEYVSSEHLLLALVSKDFGAASRGAGGGGRTRDALLQGAGRGARIAARDRSRGRGEIPGAGQIHPRPDRRWPGRASWTRSSAATRRCGGRCRCCRAGPRTTRC